MQRHYHLWTIGCQMNEADTQRLAARLEAIGYAPSPHMEQAEVIVLNTCVIRQQAEDKIHRQLSQFKTIKARRPELTLAVMGCLVGKRELPKLQQCYPYVDVFLPPSEPAALLDLLQNRALDIVAEAQETRCIVDCEWPILPPSAYGRTVTAQVPVVLGCSHTCSFCIIPSRRGAERSRTHEVILAEVRQLAEHGIREVTLLGQIVDRYGLDLGTDYELSHLLEDVACIAGLERIRFLTSHPNWMTDRLLDTVAGNPKLCPLFELPIQAGNDTVLANMRRGYTVRQFRDLVARIRQRMPEAGINTDIIVGFPSETEAQFKDTVQVLEDLRLDVIHLAQYSERPGTLAALRLPDDVPPAEKQRRWEMIEALGKRILDEKHQTLRGQTIAVLVEGHDAKRNRWWGRTLQGTLVFFPDPQPRLGQIVTVLLDWTGPFTMLGQPVKT